MIIRRILKWDLLSFEFKGKICLENMFFHAKLHTQYLSMESTSKLLFGGVCHCPLVSYLFLSNALKRGLPPPAGIDQALGGWRRPSDTGIYNSLFSEAALHSQSPLASCEFLLQGEKVSDLQS